MLFRSIDVGNTDRSFGTIFGSEITKKYYNTLEDDTFTAVSYTHQMCIRDSLSPVAHLAAIEGKVPFINFFDGFRLSLIHI